MIDYDAFIKEALERYDVRGVLHLGACAPCMQLSIYSANKIPQIVLVEGNPELVESFSQHHPILPPGCQLISTVISDIDDKKIPFRLIYSKDMANKGCSSLFKSSSSSCFNNFFEKEVLQLETMTVDTMLQRNGIQPTAINLLVMDIQGAELLALRGATKLLPNLDAIVTEVSWDALYEEQALVHEIDDFLNEHGFVREKTMKCHDTWGESLYVKK
jgi:FkbM family methyltransferase